MNERKSQRPSSPGPQIRTAPLVAVFLGFLLTTNPPLWAQGEPRIEWQEGPTTVKLANLGQMSIPAGYRFTNAVGARQFSELTQNPPDGTEIGVLIPPVQEGGNMEDFWFILFKYEAIGHVSDEEGSTLDSATKSTILDSLRQGTEQANEIRKQKGWPPLLVVDWQQEPFYDVHTHNLKWAVLCTSNGQQSINLNTRLLCREGVMSANMVIDPRFVSSAMPAYNTIIGSIDFNSESHYASFRAGDKVAEYGLVALIAGGIGTTAIKTGLFAKYLKPILVGLFVLFASVFKKLKQILSRVATGQTGPYSTNNPFGESPRHSEEKPRVTQPPSEGPTVIVSCPHCGQKNRIPTDRLTDRPVCGRCHKPVIMPATNND